MVRVAYNKKEKRFTIQKEIRVALKKTLGIIGGMGPAATCDLMEQIIELTAAKTDQDHIHVIADVNTAIPDRTEALLRSGPDPAPQLIASAQRLQAAGADFLAMACNTAHSYYGAVADSVLLPILHMPGLTAMVLREASVRRAAVLATEGTVRSGVYAKVLAGEGIEPVYPSPEHQALLMRLIYDGVKARKISLSDIPVEEILSDLRARGAEKFILGCTELPIAFRALGVSRDCLDPTRVLAFAAVKYAGGETTVPDPW